jgi:hypothetical protein
MKFLMMIAITLGGANLVMLLNAAAGTAVGPAVVAAKKGKNSPVNEKLILASKIFRQADAVAREMWWVVAADRRPAQRSPFGKVSRASMMEAGMKLPKNVNYKCDNYLIKKDESKSPVFQVEVFESCIAKSPARIANWTLFESGRIEIEFYPENLSDLLGLGASVMNKVIHCQLESKNGILKSLSCQPWTQDRNATEIVDLSRFEYHAESPSLMEIKGFILENLNPKKKIETKVPLEGKIVVTETEIPDPTKKPLSPPPVAAKPAARISPSSSQPLRPQERSEGEPPSAGEPSSVQFPPPGSASPAMNPRGEERPGVQSIPVRPRPGSDTLPDPEYVPLQENETQDGKAAPAPVEPKSNR